MNDEQLQPFNWWFSGTYWYCNLKRRSMYKPVTGCGPTKPQAVADARRELMKRDAKKGSDQP